MLKRSRSRAPKWRVHVESEYIRGRRAYRAYVWRLYGGLRVLCAASYHYYGAKGRYRAQDNGRKLVSLLEGQW
jgi:hypothetical protein